MTNENSNFKKIYLKEDKALTLQTKTPENSGVWLINH